MQPNRIKHSLGHVPARPAGKELVRQRHPEIFQDRQILQNGRMLK